MKQFLIRYRRGAMAAETWHQEIAHFIAALDGNPDLRGRISYRAMRVSDNDEYLHLATAADDQAIGILRRANTSAATTNKRGWWPVARSRF
jgi:hypothetical protein